VTRRLKVVNGENGEHQHVLCHKVISSVVITGIKKHNVILERQYAYKHDCH